MYRVYKTRILGCRNTLSSCFKNCSLSPVWSLTQNTQKSWTQSIPIFAGCISYYYYQKWWAVCSLFQKLDFIACRVLDSKVLHWIGRSVRRVGSRRNSSGGIRDLIWEICANSFCTLSQRSAGVFEDYVLSMTPCRINSNSNSYQIRYLY